jgi:hypothetical protein
LRLETRKKIPLLQSNVAPPYQVAMLSTLLAGGFSTVTANLMIKAQKLF